MPVKQANFLAVCAVAAIGLTASLAVVLAITASRSAQARIEAPVGTEINPLQMMMNSKGLPDGRYDDYTLVFH
jgi:hypothetical protein